MQIKSTRGTKTFASQGKLTGIILFSVHGLLVKKLEVKFICLGGGKREDSGKRDFSVFFNTFFTAD